MNERGFDVHGNPCLHPTLSEKSVEPMACPECGMEFADKGFFTSGEMLGFDRDDVFDRRPASDEE